MRALCPALARGGRRFTPALAVDEDGTLAGPESQLADAARCGRLRVMAENASHSVAAQISVVA